MIVVAIIGLLAAIAISSLVKVRAVARENIVHNDLRLISDAVDQLAFDTGKWPGGLPAGPVANPEVWDLNTTNAGLLAGDSSFPHWKGPYIRRVPVDPWGSDYFFDPDYRIGGTMYPTVGSFGPNRRGRNVYDDDNCYVIMK